ncbi:Plasmodium exported protein (Pm-fam-a like), unknown function [Plasmodium malariae]|uniref:Fam-l protein n=1 Tax=Plasmodium malariae TaxID=5858 RepID=A0A1A8WYZ2_PLAMA|nr:Plasmodium exported protein (Pm-fam-a like), unknown function [Plasmodium malariae]
MFILLTQLYHFNNNNFYTSLDEKNSFDRKLDVTSYRLLSICKQDKNSSILGLKDEKLYNKVNEKEDISYNEKWAKTKNNHSFIGSSKNERIHKKVTKNKSNIFETRKHSQLEKNIFKELDYIEFLKSNRTISNKLYRKIVFKKYSLRIFAPVTLLLLLLIYIILDKFFSCGLIEALIYILNLCCEPKWFDTLHNILKGSEFSWFFKSINKVKNVLVRVNGSTETPITDHLYVESFFGYFVYIVPLLTLGLTLTLGVLYYHKKIKKYQKLKFGKS